MTNVDYYTDLEHVSTQYSTGESTSRTQPFQLPSDLIRGAVKHLEKEFKDYYCPFCGHRLFRGKVRDFKMVCHECNRLVDSRALEEEQSSE